MLIPGALSSKVPSSKEVLNNNSKWLMSPLLINKVAPLSLHNLSL
jgi:hypothetical protein